MEKAKRLREERKNGIVDAENATFAPQINRRPQYLNQTRDTLDNEVRLQTNDIFEQPLPGAAGKARHQQQEFGGLPSPGSDALGREMKTHNANTSNTGLGRSRHPDGLTDAQYKSKFLQQYETDKLQKQQNNGYDPEYAPPRQQQQQARFEEQEDQFTSMLRADAGKAVGPGWNDDTSSSGFSSKKANAPQPANRHVVKKQPVSHAAPHRSHVQQSPSSYMDNYNNEQQQEQQQQQQQQQYGREQQTRQPRQSSSRPPPRQQLPEWNGGDGDSFAIPDVPPPHRTASKVASPRGGGGASGAPVPGCVMRSKLSLLKSKIRQSESSGGARAEPNGPSPNVDGFGGGGGGMMKSNSSKAHGAFVDDMPVGGGGDRRNTAPDMYGRAGGGGYVEDTDDYQRNPADAAPRAGRRGPQPSAATATAVHQRGGDGRQQQQQQQYDRYQQGQDQGGGYQPSNQAATRRAAAPPRNNAGWNGADENDHEYSGHQSRQQQQPPQQRQQPAPAVQSMSSQSQSQSMMSEYPPGGGPPAEYLDAGDGSAGGPQFECPDCGRKFNEIPYQKHVKICQKVFQNKRKVFDSAQMRTKGIEDLEKLQAQAKKEEKKQQKQQKQQKQKPSAAPAASQFAPDRPAVAAAAGGDGGKAAKWKEQSQAFREAMKAARNYTKAVATGAPLPPPVASAPDPSLRECPNCNRRFNEKAAERHIPLCKNIIAKPKALVRGAGGGGGINGAPTASTKRGKGKW